MSDLIFLPYRLLDVKYPEWLVPALLIAATMLAGR